MREGGIQAGGSYMEGIVVLTHRIVPFILYLWAKPCKRFVPYTSAIWNSLNTVHFHSGALAYSWNEAKRKLSSNYQLDLPFCSLKEAYEDSCNSRFSDEHRCSAADN